MSEVSIRDLRNDGGRVLDLVTGGASLTVTRDGRPVAELRPLARPPLAAESLLRRWRHLPRIDAARLRADLDRVVDSAL